MAKNVYKKAIPAAKPVAAKKPRKPRAKKAVMPSNTSVVTETVTVPVAEPVMAPVQETLVETPVVTEDKASKYQMIAIGVFIVAYFALLFSYLM